LEPQEQEPVLQKHFSNFVQLRKSNYSPEEAWRVVQEQAKDLPSQLKRHLATLVQSWEARAGQQYRADNDPDMTHMTGSLGRIKPLPSMSRRKIGTQTSEFGTVPPDVSKYFGKNTILLIYLPTTKDPMRVQIPLRDEVIIGRSAPDSILIPDIDMSDLGEQYGVSRVHASLKRKDDTLLITDLGSRNHTFVNDDQLRANEIRALRSGDELRFGNLVTRIRFYNNT
jgi:hypothetical protein